MTTFNVMTLLLFWRWWNFLKIANEIKTAEGVTLLKASRCWWRHAADGVTQLTASRCSWHHIADGITLLMASRCWRGMLHSASHSWGCDATHSITFPSASRCWRRPNADGITVTKILWRGVTLVIQNSAWWAGFFINLKNAYCHSLFFLSLTLCFFTFLSFFFSLLLKLFL